MFDFLKALLLDVEVHLTGTNRPGAMDDVLHRWRRQFGGRRSTSGKGRAQAAQNRPGATLRPRVVRHTPD